MATKNKTTWTRADVNEFINSEVDSEQKKADSFELIRLMKKWTGFEPEMWGPTIIGFGRYQYRYASGHEGEAPVIGFSPRKAALSLYIYPPDKGNEHLLEGLGKFKMGKACIYAKKLSDLNLGVMERLCLASLDYVKTRHGLRC